MPVGMAFQGLYINLDRSESRRVSLLQHFAACGVDARSYYRLSAVEPRGDEPELQRGLKSRGELGIWQSMILALETIASGDFAPVVHLIEDDIRLAPWAPQGLGGLQTLMQTNAGMEPVDVVFLDYFMNAALCQAVVSSPAYSHEPIGGGLSFLPGNAYLASLSSMLVRRSSAAYLAQVLRRALNTMQPLIPVDNALRGLIRAGAVNALLVAPTFSAFSWEEDEASTIQVTLPDGVRDSQRAHLLLRILAAGLETPQWCAERMVGIYGMPHGLHGGSTMEEFLHYFGHHVEIMARF